MSDLCQRSLEIEAWFDRRLEDPSGELADHVDGCVDCGRQLDSLRGVRERLEKVAEPNPFVMKRLRREMLSKAAGPEAARSTVRPTRVVGAFAAFGVVLAGLLLWSFRAPKTPSEWVVITAPSASYTSEDDGVKKIVRLDDGELSLDVQSHEHGKKLVVIVPDGEIEDIGTRFKVVVESGATKEISVESGEVVFTKHGAPPLHLFAGMRYRATDATAHADSSDHGAVAPHSNASVASSSPAVRTNADASDDSVASSRPSTSASAHRTGLMAEDAAYLEIVRAVREGRSEDARAAASRYLQRFPKGLRSREAATVLAR